MMTFGYELNTVILYEVPLTFLLPREKKTLMTMPLNSSHFSVTV